MNNNHFFALFDLPVSFAIDQDILKNNLIKLQKQHHPDRAASSIDQNASLINHAYNILSHDDSRAAYLLSLNDQAADLDKSIDDWDFLGEMMEIRIELEETSDRVLLQAMAEQVTQKSQSLAADFNQAYQARDWIIAKDIAQKLQFVGKLHQDIIAKLSESLHQNSNDDDLYV